MLMTTQPHDGHPEEVAITAAPTMRVFLVSDLHADCSHNMRWCENLEREADSALIVAGDVATDLGAIGRCLKVLLDRYDVVFYTPGAPRRRRRRNPKKRPKL